LAGGFAADGKGWRWTIWVLMWIAGLTLLMLLVFLPETSSKNILYRRAQRLRKLTGNDKFRTEAEIAFQHVTFGKIAQMTIVRPWILTFTEPLIFLLHLWVALIFGVLFVWFESFPLVFVGIYGFNLGQTGLAFMGLLIGGLASVPPFVWYCRSVLEKQFNEKGQIIKPELRLPPAMIAAVCLPVSLFWFGFSARADVHWIVCISGTAFYAIGTLLVVVSIATRWCICRLIAYQNSVLNYLPDAYPNEMASVMAGNAFIRFTSGAAFPLFAPAMYATLGIEWATALLAFLTLLFVPIPFLFYFVSAWPSYEFPRTSAEVTDVHQYGETLRKRSSRARKD
jgi:MFS transporter, DHA1 family, multidrug resistance protein